MVNLNSKLEEYIVIDPNNKTFAGERNPINRC